MENCWIFRGLWIWSGRRGRRWRFSVRNPLSRWHDSKRRDRFRICHVAPPGGASRKRRRHLDHSHHPLSRTMPSSSRIQGRRSSRVSKRFLQSLTRRTRPCSIGFSVSYLERLEEDVYLVVPSMPRRLLNNVPKEIDGQTAEGMPPKVGAVELS